MACRITRGNQLFRKLIGPIIVRAIGGERGQPVSVMVGADQMIGSRLGGAYGLLGAYAVIRRKRDCRRSKRAVNLIRRNMQKAKSMLFAPCSDQSNTPVFLPAS